MELRRALSEKIERLTAKGVSFPNPLTVDIGDEVDVGRISGAAVTVFPGCRIYGSATVISAGVQIGREGPATIEDCQLGPRVELKAGFFARSVFLEQSSLGLGAQVREACILEEQAGGAHCVGLKQTILFPFVTLGSLINFCDCLMAGGTSRKHHSEVGSSYVHFNFTPEGDKTTASLMGDVPRGVMLNQPPIFLGGQGGLVGPLRLGFGNVVAAGTVLNRDVPADGQLIHGASHAAATREFRRRAYPGLRRIVRNNFAYLANLAALEQWYVQVRRSFFAEQELGEPVYRGALEKLALATEERCKRLQELAGKLAAPAAAGESEERDAALRGELRGSAGRLRELLAADVARQAGLGQRDLFLAGLGRSRRDGAGYLETIQGLPADVSRAGTEWLERIVDDVTGLLESQVPALGAFRE